VVVHPSAGGLYLLRFACRDAIVGVVGSIPDKDVQLLLAAFQRVKVHLVLSRKAAFKRASLSLVNFLIPLREHISAGAFAGVTAATYQDMIHVLGVYCSENGFM
jgi:hypothetical protein